jgi:magnesium-transporting ATPase (P-type)
MPTISKMLYMETSQDDDSKEENDILSTNYFFTGLIIGVFYALMVMLLGLLFSELPTTVVLIYALVGATVITFAGYFIEYAETTD